MTNSNTTTSNKTFSVSGIAWSFDGVSLEARHNDESILITKRGAQWTTSRRFSPVFATANAAAKWIAQTPSNEDFWARSRRNRAAAR